MQKTVIQTGQRVRAGVAPALMLFFLSPLIGEFLLGNLPITWLWTLMVLAPMYGGGALLIREVARRFGLGWVGIFLFGLAYAIIEEAFVTQSLFNPNYVGLRLLDYGYLPSLGIGSWWTVFVLAIHTIWSTATPIALAETLSGDRRRTPWLGKIGLAVVVLLFLFGCVASSMAPQGEPFRATTTQFIVSAVVVGLLCAGAFGHKRIRAFRSGSRPAAATYPSPQKVGLLAFCFGGVFMGLAIVSGVIPAALNVIGMLSVIATAAVVLYRYSRSPAWAARHEAAFAGGFLFTYAWYGFVQPPSVGETSKLVDMLGNAVFALGAVALWAWVWKRARNYDQA